MSSLDAVLGRLRVDAAVALESLEEVAVDIRAKTVDVTAELDRKADALRIRAARLEEREAALRKNAGRRKSKVKLNVGGEVFAISKTDLLQHEDSLFYAMLGSDDWLPGSDGAYFMDLSPRYFSLVLDYVRGETVSLQRLDERELAEVRALFEYLHLEFAFVESEASPELRHRRRTRSEDLDGRVALACSAVSTADALSSSVRARLHTAMGEIAAVFGALDSEMAVLAAREELLDHMQSAVRAHAATATDLVSLDVGGKVFTTARSNLLRLKGSYFEGLLSGRWQPDEDGRFFINRNPEHFPLVLDLARTGRVSLEGADHEGARRVLELFEYLQLKVPYAALCWDATKSGPDLVISNGGKTVAREGRFAQSAAPSETTAILGAQSVTRFSVRIDALSWSTKTSIGFAPRDSFDVCGKNSLNCGWYLYLSSGTLISRSTYNKPYSSAIGVGDVLTAVHDTQRGEISFERDGKSLGVAFVDIPRSSLLYPAVDLCCSSEGEAYSHEEEEEDEQGARLSLTLC